MSATQSAQQFQEIADRWHHLAERRLAHYTELLSSGRWRRYYADERTFALRMFDVIRAARTWARIAGRQSTAGEASDRGKGDDLRPAA